MCVFLGGEGRSSGNVPFASSNGINTSALVVTDEDSMTIAAAAERAEGTAAEIAPLIS